MHHEGNLIITKDNAHQYTGLTSVGMDLSIRADCQAPMLTSVGGYLSIRADFQAPMLTSIGGNLSIRADFQAPMLTSIGGNLSVCADFRAPELTSVGGGLYINADFQAPGLTSVRWNLYIQADFQAPMLVSAQGEALTKPIKCLLNLEWSVLVTDNYIRIGCQRHTKAEWAAFTDNQIKEMAPTALEFWREHKEQILAL